MICTDNNLYIGPEIDTGNIFKCIDDIFRERIHNVTGSHGINQHSKFYPTKNEILFLRYWSMPISEDKAEDTIFQQSFNFFDHFLIKDVRDNPPGAAIPDTETLKQFARMTKKASRYAIQYGLEQARRDALKRDDTHSQNINQRTLEKAPTHIDHISKVLKKFIRECRIKKSEDMDEFSFLSPECERCPERHKTHPICKKSIFNTEPVLGLIKQH